MYSILLVEDEKGIRENIQRGIVWEKLGFYIAASASNGEQAMEKLEKFQPDVLLTDIRMPFMDGLELSRMVKRIMPMTRIVILSGYMEFAYAKEAISIGVEEYLVKPVTPMKLLKTFTALKEKMDAQRQQEVSYASFAGGLWEVEDQLTENTVKNIDVNDLKRMNERVNTLWTFLQQGSMAEVESFTDQYLARCEPGMLSSVIYRYYFLVQMLTMCMKAIETLGGDPEIIYDSVQDVRSFLNRVTSVEKAKEELKKILCVVLRFRDQSVHRAEGQIWNAESYIREHFREESLSLGDVAEHVGLSPNYFSYVFKQKTGDRFIKYLTNLRLAEAKLLLKTTNLTTAEIAEKIGYSNVNYFSTVFHKTVGVTPKAFREA